jgi:hypothetical protein
MRSQRRPAFTPEEVFDACAERFTDPEYKKRLDSVRDQVLAASSTYADKGASSRLHEIKPLKRVGEAANADMRRLYSQGMLRRRSIARRYYEDIRLAARHNICPICNQRPVASLEHYLAKSEFSLFTVLPDNLIPSCYDCNFDKNAAVFDQFETSPLHPYFDDLGSDKWLQASIVERNPPVPIFSVAKGVLSKGLRAKVKNHMKTFGLYSLYAEEGAAELSRNAAVELSFFRNGGGDALRGYLQKRHNSVWRVEPNSWRAALYAACAENDWYVECKWAA